MNELTGWTYPRARILIFGKAPYPGRVKKRLANVIGTHEAAHSYAIWVEQQVHALIRAQLAPVELWVSPDTRHPLFSKLRNALGVSVHKQPAGDLGERMEKVFQLALARSEMVVLVGSDCPAMTPGYVYQALKALASGIDIVFGPAEDGGYVLVGQKTVHPALFRDIPWSSSKVLQVSRRRLLAERQYWAELETLWDIDTVENYRRWEAVSRNQTTNSNIVGYS